MHNLSLMALAPLVLVACAQPVPPTPAASPTASTTTASGPRPTTELLLAGRKFAEWILANQLDSVTAHLAAGESPDSVRAHLTRLVQDIAIRGGSEVKVIEEKMVRRGGRHQYWRTAEFERAPSAVLLRIVVTPEGKYAGVGIGLASNPPPIDP